MSNLRQPALKQTRINVRVGVGGATQRFDGWVSMSCPDGLGPCLRCTFGNADATLDRGQSGLFGFIDVRISEDGTSDSVAFSTNNNMSLIVPLSPCAIQMYVRDVSIDTDIAYYGGPEKTICLNCFGVIPCELTIHPCSTFIEDGVEYVDLDHLGYLEFNLSTFSDFEFDDDNETLTRLHSEILLKPTSEGGIISGDFCDGGGSFPYDSGLESSDTVEFTLKIGQSGDKYISKNDDTYYSESGCDCSNASDITCEQVNFDGDYVTSSDGEAVTSDFVVTIDDSDGDNYTCVDSNISNICAKCGASVNSAIWLNSTKEDIVKYCGGDKFFIIYLHGSRTDYLSFYLHSGNVVPDTQNVDAHDFGMLYFCGLNMPPSSDGGIPLFNVDFDYGDNQFEYEDVGHELVNLRIFDDASRLQFCEEGYIPQLDFDCSEDDFAEEVDKLELESCDSCYADIETCCNDEQFESDLNDFSSISVPEPYINPDNGEEERLHWNGLMHVSQILNCSFKSFYALAFHMSCIWSNTIKEIANKFIEAYNIHNQYLLDISKSLKHEDKGIAQIIKDTFNEDDKSIAKILLAFKDKFEELENDRNYDIELLIDAINEKDMTYDDSALVSIIRQCYFSGSNNYLRNISAVLGMNGDGNRNGFDWNISKLLENIKDVINNKNYELSIPDGGIMSVNEIVIDSNSYAYTGNGKYSIQDDDFSNSVRI